MTSESAHGIILRRRLLTETSLIVQWLTRDHGRVATVARGARRPKSAFAGKLDLFYEADFSFSRSRSTDLHALREVKVSDTHTALRQDVGRLNRASYACGFIEQATETDTPLPGLFDLLRGFLAAVARRPADESLVLAFELKLLQALGLAPDLAETGLTAGARKIAAALQDKDFVAGEAVKPAAAQTEELRRFLHGFLIFHLGKLPKGRAAAFEEI